MSKKDTSEAYKLPIIINLIAGNYAAMARLSPKLVKSAMTVTRSQAMGVAVNVQLN